MSYRCENNLCADLDVYKSISGRCFELLGHKSPPKSLVILADNLACFDNTAILEKVRNNYLMKKTKMGQNGYERASRFWQKRQIMGRYCKQLVLVECVALVYCDLTCIHPQYVLLLSRNVIICNFLIYSQHAHYVNTSRVIHSVHYASNY